MSNITSVLNAGSSSAAANSATKSQSEKDLDSFVGTREDFLTILLAQLKHQDPLNPMEGTEFIDSITRLSAVEQSINQSSHLEKIENLLSSQQTNFGAPVSYLDKQIDFSSEVIALKDGFGQFSYELEARPDAVAVIIRDLDGKVVRRADAARDVGINIINWDGKDNSGNALPDGEYFVEVTSSNGTGDKAVYTQLPTATSGIVTGANFENGEVVLLVGNIRTTVGDITSIRSLQQQANNN